MTNKSIDINEIVNRVYDALEQNKCGRFLTRSDTYRLGLNTFLESLLDDAGMCGRYMYLPTPEGEERFRWRRMDELCLEEGLDT